ncbi:hypothetical protein [Minwuia thermotolerans]|uniref:hypothetical protein n=1 Tax=Minwuia thermotolerans TaxID=2056226 RepID=UPI001A9C316C|nr:hypothetical protein [Minwuia thermotolerans]
MGAALAIDPVISELVGNTDVAAIRMICGEPAWGHLKKRFGNHPQIELRRINAVAASPNDPAIHDLIGSCRAEIDHFRPTAILGGLSGPDIGVDEALVHAAGRERCISVQDWPGWVVHGVEGAAAHYLVANHQAAKMTRAGGVNRVTIVGALGRTRHFAVNHNSDPVRAEHTLFLGQPLHHLSGYLRTLSELGDFLSARGIEWHYRPHPRETDDEVAMLCKRLERRGTRKPPTLTGENVLSEDLARSRLVLSCFSSAIEDRMVLGTRPGIAPATSVYLLQEPDVMNAYLTHSAGGLPLPVQLGLASVVRTRGTIGTVLDGASPPRADAVLTLYPEPSPKLAARVLLGYINT